MAGCGPDGGCDAVLASRWSTLHGVPVGLLGFVIYTVLLIGSWLKNPRAAATFVHAVASLLVLFGALWFVAVQIFVMKNFCPWCCAAHALALVGVFSLWRSGEIFRGDRLGFSRVALPLGAVVSMALIQAMEAPREKIAQAELAANALSQSDGDLYLFQGKVRLKLADLPQRGGRENGPMAILVSDYTCPHCLDLQRNLREYEKQSDGRLKVIYLPGFQDPVAKEIHRALLVLWRVNPQIYWQTNDAILSGEITANYGELMAYIKKNYSGRFDLDQMAYSGWAQNILEQGESLMRLNEAATGQGTLPQLMIGGKILVGTPRVATIRDIAERAGEVKIGIPEFSNAVMPKGLVSAAAVGIEYENDHLDLGRLVEGDVRTAEFTYTNTGKDPVKILQINTSCGCIHAEEWKQTVAPGEQGHFKIHLDTDRLHGELSKVLTVLTDRSNDRHRVFVEAEVTSPLRAFPPKVSFGRVVLGEKVTPHKVNVILTDSRLNSLASFKSSNSAITSEISELEKGKKFEVAVSIDNSKLGNIIGELTTSLPLDEFPELKIPVSAKIVRAVEVIPSDLSGWPDETRPSQSDWNLRVQCYDDFRRRFKVISALYQGEQAVEVTLADQEKRPGNIQVKMGKDFSYSAAQEEGGQIVIKTNHPEISRLVVPVRVSP